MEAKVMNDKCNFDSHGMLMAFAFFFDCRITKMTFVPPTFTRKPPKYERFIRPTSLRVRKANVTHPGTFFFS